MLRLILGLLGTALTLYDLLVLVYVIVSWIKPASNQWTVLLTRLVEPALTPIRGFLNAKLPDRFRFLDWSPLALWIITGIAQRLIMLLRG